MRVAAIQIVNVLCIYKAISKAISLVYGLQVVDYDIVKGHETN